MTQALDIITQALRESNLIALVAVPTDLQVAEGLKKLSTLVSSVFGFEVGELLQDWPVGGPGLSPTVWNNPLPNSRMLVVATDTQTITFPQCPDNGARMQLIDLKKVADGSPSGRTLTINGNGRFVEGSPTIDITTGNANIVWLYRADIGNWVRLTALTADSDMPFPSEFDAFFETSLAMRLNPRYGRTMDQQSIAVLQRAAQQIQAAYRQRVPTPGDFGPTRMSVQAGRSGYIGGTFRRGRSGWMN